MSSTVKLNGLLKLIGNTPMIKIESLSELAGSDIFMKCENFNPGGTVKDRPALNMVLRAIESGVLRPGMTIVEGTAGNTGIGLAMVGQALGYKVIVVMPKGQDSMKLKLLAMYGADVHETEAVPFADDRHFFKEGKRIGTSSPNYWWVNQFDNPHNFESHYTTTGPEIFKQMNDQVDYFVAAAGSSGTMAGISSFLKQMNTNVKIHLVDPEGSGLCNFFHTGDFKVTGTYSMTEGVGITRMTDNYKLAKIDDAFTIADQYLTSLAYYIRAKEGLVMGMSSMLNLSGAFKTALNAPKGSRIATLLCDGGDRAMSKMYHADFLKEKNLDPTVLSGADLVEMFKRL